jgi:hypothetical protein
VDALTHERGASAIGAAMAVCRERSNPASQEDALELLNVAVEESHGGCFRRIRRSSCRPALDPQTRSEAGRNLR